MIRLKGGKLLIDLGIIEHEEDVTSKFPKDFINYLKEQLQGGYFNRNEILTKLKPIEISGWDVNNDFVFKGICYFIMDDDTSLIYCNVTTHVLDSICTASFEINVVDGEIIILYKYINNNLV